MRLVVDTNVFVSALLKSNTFPHQVLRRVLDHGGLLTSVATTDELLGVLQRPGIAKLTVSSLRLEITGLLATAERIEITESVAVCRDPKDDKFLELALAGNANVIVTGDADLLALHPFRGIPILTPASFIHSLRAPHPDAS